jgi:putative aldouronate transport system substrate-binding protein
MFTGGSMKKALLVLCLVMSAALIFAGGRQSGGTAASSGERRSTWVTDRKVEYTWLRNGGSNMVDPNTTPFWQMVEDATNVHINWNTVSSDNWANYVNLMWASSDYPDVAMGLSNTAYYASQGVFFPQNSIWRENMPNFMKALEAHPEIELFCQYDDGNIYGFPGLEENNPEMTNGIWIYKPWLDKLGLQMPTTEDELINVLTAFKTRDPNGNGLADEIPFAWDAKSSWTYGTVHGWFGASKDWLVRDAGAVYSPATENYRSYVKFMARLNSLGLLDPELFTQDTNTFYAKGKRDPVIYGMIMHYGLYLVAGDTSYDDYVLFAPVKTGSAPSGVVNDRYFKNNFIIFVDRGPFLFKKANNPDIFQRWLDFLYEPEIGIQATWGMGGVHIIKNANGQYEENTTVPAPYGNYYDWYFATHFQFLTYYTKWLAEPFYNASREWSEYAKKDAFYRPYFIHEPMPGIPQTTAEAEKISSYPDIGKLVSDMTPQWIAGTRDVDRDWPDYLRQLDQMGLRDYTAAYQAYVTRIRNRLGSSY